MELFNNINTTLMLLFNSIEEEGYKLIEKLSIIDINIFNITPLKIMCSEKNSKNLYLIIISLIMSFVIYYSLKLLLSCYNSNSIGDVYYFLSKVIIVTIISIYSYDICRGLINFNSQFTDLISGVLENVSEKEIGYDFLKQDVNTLSEFLEIENKMNIKGFGESITCLFILSMIIVLSVRYVLVIFCIIIAPFAIIMILSKETKFFFSLWVKVFVFCLISQSINYLFIFIPSTIDLKHELSGTIIIGSLIVLYKFNSKIIEVIYGTNK